MNQNPKNPSKLSYVIDLNPARVDIPRALLYDPDVSIRGLQVYMITRDKCHSHLKSKTIELTNDFFLHHFTSQEKFGSELPQPISQPAVSKIYTALEEAKWVKQIRPGQGNSNTIILLAYKGQVVPARILKMIGDSDRLKQIAYQVKKRSSTG